MTVVGHGAISVFFSMNNQRNQQRAFLQGPTPWPVGRPLIKQKLVVKQLDTSFGLVIVLLRPMIRLAFSTREFDDILID
jgi:hypothetical protein